MITKDNNPHKERIIKSFALRVFAGLRRQKNKWAIIEMTRKVMLSNTVHINTISLKVYGQ